MNGAAEHSRTLVIHLSERIGSEVLVKGRLAATRSHSEVSFLDIQDRSGTVQVVLDANFETPALQSVVACLGTVALQERAPGGVEIRAASLHVIDQPCIELVFNPVSLPSPCNGGGPSIESLLDHRELTLRSPKHLAIVRIASEVLWAAARFLRENGCIEIKTPKIVTGSSEGGAGLFEVKYFERVAFLAQSPQLYKQTMASTALERVFEIGPVFRAEKHATGRHLNEFVGIDVEVAYPEGLAEVTDLAARLLVSVVRHVASSCTRELDELEASLPEVSEKIPSLDLDSAKAIASGRKPSRAFPAEDLTPEDERALCEWALREHGSNAVLVHSYPLRSRPFYTLPSSRRGRSESFDLLLRGLEISSGGMRINQAHALEESMERHGLDPKKMETYLRVFKTACPPHGGFGIGLERLVQKLLGLPNVRYASLFPRDRTRLSP